MTAIAANLAAAPAGPAAVQVGRSQDGRPIVAVRVGDPRGPRIVVFGCIHGNECAGVPVALALERAHPRADLWIVPDLNPDGRAAGRRQDARGVDLNRNWPADWTQGGRPWDVYYGGARPFSEREARFARNLIVRLRPRVTIWFHQHMGLVWAWGPSTAAGRLYARLAGMRLFHHAWLRGTACHWQNLVLRRSASFDVELPAGSLSPAQVRRHVHAVLALAAATRGPSHA